MDWAKTTATGHKTHLSFESWCDFYYRFYYINIYIYVFISTFTDEHIIFSQTYMIYHLQIHVNIDLSFLSWLHVQR